MSSLVAVAFAWANSRHSAFSSTQSISSFFAARSCSANACPPVPAATYSALPSSGSLMCSSINSANRSPQSGAMNKSCRNASSLSDLLLILFICLKIFPPFETIRQALHFFLRIGVVMHVTIVLAVADLLHQRCDRVPEMQWNRFARCFGGVSSGSEISRLDGVRFGRLGQIDHGLR